MRVLITGATGFLGGTLAPYLAVRGFDVLGTGRSAPACADLAARGIEMVQADLKSPIAPERFGPVDAIVHSAALSAPTGRRAAFEAANVGATRNILAYANAVGVRRFVNISSPSVYFAPRDQLDVRESDPLPAPFNHYAATKAEAERLVLAAPEVGPISLRPRGIYGPGDQALLPRLLAVAKRQALPLFRGGRARIDLTFVGDVCAAIDAALRAGPEVEGEVFNISGGEVLPVSEIIGAACERAGVTPRWRALPFWPVKTLAAGVERLYAAMPGSPEPQVTSYGLALLAFEQSLNIEKAAARLGWRPAVRFAQGLDQVFAEGAPA